MPAFFDLLELSPWLLGAICLIVIAAAIVQTGLGMGFGLTSAPLLAVLDPALVPAPVLLLSMITAGLGAYRERAAINWSEVRLALVARAVGSGLAGLFLARFATGETFSVLFGLLVALAVVLNSSGWRLAFNSRNLFSMGSISGFMGTITSVGAPPMAIIYQGRPAHEVRPTLAAFFSLSCVISLAVLLVNDRAGVEDVKLAVFMLFPLAIGIWLANRLHGRFDKRYALWLRGLTAAAAIVLILRGLL